MCLRASTSRRPLHNTAYKVLQKYGNGHFFPMICGYANIKLGEWLVDENKNCVFYGDDVSYTYKTGFHCYLDLADAFALRKSLYYNGKVYEVFRVEFDESCAEYGVENIDYDVSHDQAINKFWRRNKDVVVSRRIKFIETII